MFASIRDTRGQGSIALYLRLRNSAGQFWDFTALSWVGTDASDARVYLTEYQDTDLRESRYQVTVGVPNEPVVAEYVRASDSIVLAEETVDNTAMADIQPRIMGLQSDVTAIQGDVTAIQGDVTAIRNSVTTPAAPALGCGLLSARILTQVRGANVFKYADAARFTQGDEGYVYFQLVDAAADQEANPPFRRYIPAVGSTLTVKLQSVDSGKTVERAAVMAFPTDDRSIWRVQVLSTDAVVGSRDMKLTLNEGGKLTRGYVKQAIAVEAQDKSR